MAYRNKTYLCFDGDNDIHYFYLMKAWKHNKNEFFKDFNFYDAHEINYARDNSKEESIKRQLLERLNNSNLFIVLVGEQTRYLTKFVRWEIEQAIKQEIPIIVINLNGKREMDENRCPPILKEHLVLHISFNQKIIEKAINEWIGLNNQLKKEKKTGPFYYKAFIYSQLGIS
jgi:hypothetical protein